MGNSNYLYEDGDPVNPISSDIPFCIEEVTPNWMTNFATLTAGSHSFLIEEVGTSNSFSFTTAVNSSLGAGAIATRELDDEDIPFYSYEFKNLFNPVGLTSLIVNFNGITSEYQIEEEHDSEEGWTRYYIGDITDSNSFELEWVELEGDWYFYYNIPTEAFPLTAPGLSQTFTISITTGQLHQLDTKYIPTASSIADGETGFVTGDQVHDALQNVSGDKWELKYCSIVWNNSNTASSVYPMLKFKLNKNGQIYNSTVYLIYAVQTEQSATPVIAGQIAGITATSNIYSMTINSVSLGNNDYVNISGILYEDSECTKIISNISCSSYAKALGATYNWGTSSKGYAQAGQVVSYVNNRGFITSSSLNNYARKSELSTVATTGKYNDLINKPPLVLNIATGNSETRFPSEIVDFVEIVPTSQYSNSVIVDYNAQ